MWTQPVVQPRYDSACFSLIPTLLRAALTDGRFPLLEQLGWNTPFQKVVFFYIDAFGWHQFAPRADAYPALRRFLDHGHAARWTSQFPSTTAAHVTTMFTGEEVGQHGVYEWFYYEPTVDIVITPLMFTIAGSKEPEKLQAVGADPARIIPQESWLEEEAIAHIPIYVFQNRLFAHSTYSKAMTHDARVIPFRTLSQALTTLRLMLETHQGPGLYYVYYEALDAIAHEHGPQSPHMEAEVDTFLRVFERQFFARLDRKVRDTLIVLSADHGMMAVDPKTTLYVNQHPLFKDLRPLLRRNARGALIAPAGSPRDMFFYVQPGREEEAREILARITEGRADVVLTHALIEQGYFGSLPVSERFLARVGDIVVLPYTQESVWWYEKDKFEQKQYGHHGGLSPEEMEIPLLLLPL